MKTKIKNILVLSRKSPEEAMRVAAGLTIFGHNVRLVFMDRPLSEDEVSGDNAELMILADIEPETTVSAMADDLPLLDSVALSEAMTTSDVVVNV